MWHKLPLHIIHNVLYIVISRHRQPVRIVVVVVLVSPGLYLGANLHIRGSILRLHLLFLLQYTYLSYAFHDIRGPLRCQYQIVYMNENIFSMPIPYRRDLLWYRCASQLLKNTFHTWLGVILGIVCPLNGRIKISAHPDISIFPERLQT